MGTVVATRGSRPRSLIVFWALIAIVIAMASSSLLLQQAPSLGEVDPTVAMGEADALGDGSGLKAASALVVPAAEPAMSLLTSDRVDDGSAVVEAPGPVDDARIVRTASLELEVEDVSTTLAAARRAMAALGGYVAGSDEVDQGESRWATVTYRVPVERFGEAIESLRGLSDRVVRESTQSTEVTATIVDLDARIDNLRASEAALVEIMDRAGRIDDVLAVQARLEIVRGQIEQLDAQRSHLADQAALSTLTVSWFTPVAAVTVAQQGWDLGSEVDAALARTVEVLQGLASLAIWFAVVVLPLAGVPLLVVAALLVLLRRRGRVSVPATD
jgi:hypothetical protein